MFIRVCSKTGPVLFNAIRDIVYKERYGVSFADDSQKSGDQKRAINFEHKDLNLMDNCVFFFASSNEVEKLKENNFTIQLFNMNRWVEL